MNSNLYGIDLNTMTSSALTSYGVKLTNRMKELNDKKAAGLKLTGAEKKEYEATDMALGAVANQNKRLIKIDSKLKAAGINLGSVKSLSYNSMSQAGVAAIDRELGNLAGKSDPESLKQTKKLNDARKLLGRDKVISKGQLAFKLAEDAMKVTGTVAATVAVVEVAQIAATGIGKIPVGNETLKTTVDNWLSTNNLPGVSQIFTAAAIAGAAFFVAKKMKEYKSAENMTYMGAQAAQEEFEDKAMKEQDARDDKNRNVSIQSEAARAEIDPSYMETLKANLGGKTVEEILAEGPAGKFDAAQYNAARILSAVKQKADKENAAVKSEYEITQTQEQLVTLDQEIGDIDLELGQLSSEITTLEGEKNVADKISTNGVPDFSGTGKLSGNADKRTLNKAIKLVKEVAKLMGKTEPVIDMNMTNDAFGSVVKKAKRDLTTKRNQIDSDLSAKRSQQATKQAERKTKVTQKKTAQQKLIDMQATRTY